MTGTPAETLVRLTPLETAFGIGIGTHHAADELPPGRPAPHPRRALEEAILPALLRPPCLVMFSGGRDSSAVLAVAAAVARREGLALPIPVTQVFPAFPGTREDGWQRSVIDHLRLTEWSRVTMEGDNNFLGAEARGFIERHGLVTPAGVTQSAPVLRAAGHGTVLTGLEGDGLFNGGRFAAPRGLASGRGAVTARGVVGLCVGAAPAPLRVGWHRARNRVPTPWLRRDAARELRLLLARDEAAEPLRWDRRVAWWSRQRYVVGLQQALALLAGDFAADIRHPLLDPGFLASMAAWGGRWGRGDRTALMRQLFGDLLPGATVERTSKADFTAPFWSGEARQFIERWNGTGLPEELVDLEALREVWAAHEPDAGTATLLQAAWLSERSGRQVEEGFNCRLR